MDFLSNISSLMDSILGERNITIDELSALFNEHPEQYHLAMLHQPYIDRILSGEKTIESRFMNSRQPPYGKIGGSDIMLLKQTSGPVLGIALVKEVLQYGPLKPGGAEEVLSKYKNELCVEKEFVNLKKNSKYAVLIRLAASVKISPFSIIKRDRRAWVVL